MEQLAQTIELRPDPCELRLMRAFVSHWAERSELTEEERFRACLVATEAVTNAMRHAGGNGSSAPIAVSCRVERSELVVEVTDRGRFRTPPDDGDGDLGGRGLFLIRELTREFELEAGDHGTHLCMRLGALERPLALSSSAA